MPLPSPSIPYTHTHTHTPRQVAPRQQRGVQPGVHLPAGKLVQQAVRVDAHQLLHILVACAAGRRGQFLPVQKQQQPPLLGRAGQMLGRGGQSLYLLLVEATVSSAVRLRASPASAPMQKPWQR